MPESRRNSIINNGGEIRLKGRLRDEFVCPITRQIMREPVTAADGHTYDHTAISRWLANHNTSPKTGEELPSHIIIPNFNLKRLIEDFLSEGGHGLIHTKKEKSSDSKSNNNNNNNNNNENSNSENSNSNSNSNDVDDDSDEEFVLTYEKTIILNCLGPADSPFCGRDIRVGKDGTSGGRKRMASGTKDCVIFTDATVSRRHFEINYNENVDDYQITDLGSAGGTFIRIPFGEGMEIFEGMMILVGKHQFECINRNTIENDNVSVDTEPEILQDVTDRDNNDNNNINVQQNLERNDTAEDMEDANLNSENMETNTDIAQQNDANGNKKTHVRNRRGTKNEMQINENNWIDGMQRLALEGSQHLNTSNGRNNGKIYDFPLALRCFAPEGSPIQDQIFDVNAIQGTTIGRKEQNDIALCHYRAGELLGLDSAVSGEHANISFDNEKKKWILNDGVADKQSTNGTWYRLSAMQEMSEPHVIKNKSEILIGTLRFVAKEDEELVEKDI